MNDGVLNQRLKNQFWNLAVKDILIKINMIVNFFTQPVFLQDK